MTRFERLVPRLIALASMTLLAACAAYAGPPASPNSGTNSAPTSPLNVRSMYLARGEWAPEAKFYALMIVGSDLAGSEKMEELTRAFEKIPNAQSFKTPNADRRALTIAPIKVDESSEVIDLRCDYDFERAAIWQDSLLTSKRGRELEEVLGRRALGFLTSPEDLIFALEGGGDEMNNTEFLYFDIASISEGFTGAMVERLERQLRAGDVSSLNEGLAAIRIISKIETIGKYTLRVTEFFSPGTANAGSATTC